MERDRRTGGKRRGQRKNLGLWGYLMADFSSEHISDLPASVLHAGVEQDGPRNPWPGSVCLAHGVICENPEVMGEWHVWCLSGDLASL